jgi:GTP-binding protein EngB required for normal cell division
MKPTLVEFAIIGHPNEGKSSVLSTLAEDDSVRVSSIPGETVVCQSFPVRIDGREIIRFIDTPGFQNPRQTLAWFQAYEGPEEALLNAFIVAHEDDPAFHDDCELLRPVAAGAGLIFVVDGSRPLRQVDRAEMEILRLSGAPRMAVINSKEDDVEYLSKWQSEFRKHFNAVRVFNSCRANYRQRIDLLESLKSIDQELEPVLRQVVEAFQDDWEIRSQRTAALLADCFLDILNYRKTVPCAPEEEEAKRRELHGQYLAYVSEREREAQQAIRGLFKHNIFNLELPPQSILEEDLFSNRTWQFLGLTNRQIILAGALGGAALGVGIDAATVGTSFGLFSAIGGLIGAGATALKGKGLLSGVRLLGTKMGGEQLRVGPVNNIQLLYILLDRGLLFYSHVINWAHGRRDYERMPELLRQSGGKAGFTSRWSREQRAVCDRFFRAIQKGHEGEIEETSVALQDLLRDQFLEIAEDRAGGEADADSRALVPIKPE